MDLLWVCLLVAAVSTPGMVEGVDLFCDCRDRGNHTVALHCDQTQAERTDVTCRKAAAATVPDLPRGYKFVAGYAVVKLHRTFKQWSDAKQRCQAEGSRLAVPPGSYAVDGLKPVFAEEKGIWYAFVGFPEDNRSEVLGANLTQKATETGEQCPILRSDGVMSEAPCSSVSPFLCERRLPRVLPNGYSWDEDAGRFYKVHPSRRSRALAAAACVSEDATLAVADTWLRATVLLRLLEPSPELHYAGLTDHGSEGDFVTDSGRHLNDMEFQLWAPGQPNNDGGGREEDCLALSVEGYSDVRCDMELRFVCEILPQ